MNSDKGQKADHERGGAEAYPEQELTGRILESAFTVHNTLGAGFLERVYANALALEMRACGLPLMQEVPFKIHFRNAIVGDYVADLVVDNRVLVELKACAVLDSAHTAQI